MSTKQRRSNVVAKALLITALASGIAGMQAAPAFASTIVNNKLDFDNSFKISLTDTDVVSTYLYYTPVDVTDSQSGHVFKAGTLYFEADKYITHENWDETRKTYTALGDAKSILGGSSSSGLSEEQKTIVKNLIANWPRFFRLVEKFFERNDDYNGYDKKT